MIPIGKFNSDAGEFLDLQLSDFQNSGASSTAAQDYAGYQELMRILKGLVTPGEVVNRDGIYSFITHYGGVTPLNLGYLNGSYSYLMIGGGIICYNILPSMQVGNLYVINHYLIEFNDNSWPTIFSLLYSLESVQDDVRQAQYMPGPYNGNALFESFSNLTDLPDVKASESSVPYKYNYYSNNSGTVTVKAITFTYAWNVEKGEYVISHSAAANSAEEPKNYSIQVAAAASDQIMYQTLKLVQNSVKTVVNNLSTFFVSR